MSQTLDKANWLGANVIQWVRENHVDDGLTFGTTIAILVFRSILSHSDAASILLKKGSSESTPLIARTVLEGVLSLKWLLKGNLEENAKAYFVADRMREIAMLKTFQAGSPQNVGMMARLADNDYLHDTEFDVTQKQIEDRVRETEIALSGDDLKHTYEDLKKISSRPDWYSASGGPRSLNELAARLGMLGLYESVYRMLSESAHFNDAIKRGRFQSGNVVLSPLRTPWVASSCFYNTILCVNMATKDMVKYFGDDFQWNAVRYTYVAHIRDQMNDLSQVSFSSISPPSASAPSAPTA